MRHPHQDIRFLIWIYFILIILEGALRKWILPQLHIPLLVVRDPVLILIFALAYQKSLFPFNRFVVIGLFMAIASAPMAFAGHGNLFVMAFGIRANFIHAILIFIIPMVYTQKDVWKIGKWVLWISLPMTVIIFFQFISPQSAWINRAPGGTEGGGFGGALGYYRPPGTFSFITGTAYFYTLVSAFVVAGLLQKGRYPQWLLYAAGVCVVVAMPMSISRAMVLSIAIVGAAGLMIAALNRQAIGRVVGGGITLAIAAAVASQLPVFEPASEAFMSRWDAATGERSGGFQGAIVMRVWEAIATPFVNLFEQDIFGAGIGLGTQVGAVLVSGATGFLLAENEFGRVISELGLFLGPMYLFWRIGLAVFLGHLAYLHLKNDNFLPWLLFAACAFSVMLGQWGQPNILGFTVLISGLALAAMLPDPVKEESEEGGEPEGGEPVVGEFPPERNSLGLDP